MVTRFGAFYDSTLDRVGDGATFIGIGAFLLTAPDVAYRVLGRHRCAWSPSWARCWSPTPAPAPKGWASTARSGSPSGRSGFCWLGFASLLVGAGPHALVLEAIVALLALASIITVVQRFVYVYQRGQRRGRLRPGSAHARGQPTRVRRRRWILWRKDVSSG